jgi:6-phosphogluconolactonase
MSTPHAPVSGPCPASDVHCLDSADDVATWLADRISAQAAAAVRERGRFSLVLAGGRTPLAAYTLLADRAEEWERWHIFYGDERCLPVDDPERNSRAAATAWLDRVSLPRSNQHPIPAELGAEAAAAAYADEIADWMPFDMVLLGMGEDGHTASLFPGQGLAEDRLVIPVHGAPKPPADRVSLTPGALAASRVAMIVATGAGKRAALDEWRRGQPLPVARVAALACAEVVVDRDAAGPGPISVLPGTVPG